MLARHFWIYHYVGATLSQYVGPKEGHYALQHCANKVCRCCFTLHGKKCHSLERNSTLPSHSNPFRVFWGITHEDNYLRSLILFLLCYIYRKHSSIYNLRITSWISILLLKWNKTFNVGNTLHAKRCYSVKISTDFQH